MDDTTAIDGNDLDDVADNLILDQEPAAEEPEADGLDDQAEEPDTEGEPEEEVDETSDEDDDDEEAEEADEEPAETLYTVKVDGQERQVSLDELRRGYSGQEYIQGQMRTVAEGRKQIEQLYSQLQQETQQVTALRQQLESGGIPAKPKPPSRDFFNQDYIGYMEAKLKYDDDLAEWQGKTQELQAVSVRQQQMQQQALAYTLQQEMSKLQQAIPEFADREKGPQLRSAILEAGTEYGFAPEELSEVADSRAVRVLHDAMKYRQLMAARGDVQKKVDKARPMVKPGAKQSANAGKAKQRKQAEGRMRATGSVDDVAKFLLS